MKKIIALLLTCVMVLGLFAGCGGGKTQETKAPENQPAAGAATEAPGEAAPDTIVIMAPPVTGSYLENLRVWAADFH